MCECYLVDGGLCGKMELLYSDWCAPSVGCGQNMNVRLPHSAARLLGGGGQWPRRDGVL